MTTIAVPAARTALEAAGLPEATASPSGQIASAGYLVTPLRALGPDRAAVCRCELVITTSGGYLAVLPPKARHDAPTP
jgi:hypothetical protein